MNGCLKCARKKPPVPKSHGLHAKNFSAQRVWSWVEFDLLGPFPRSKKGNMYIAVMICRFSRYPELVGIRDTTAEAAAEAFVNEIVCRHGVPDVLLTDRGSNFTSRLMSRVATRLRCKKLHALTAHAQTIGTAEKLNQFITNAVYAYVDEEGTDWDEILPSISMAYRTSVVEAIGMTPAELVYGRKLRVPQDLMFGDQGKEVVDQKQYNLRLLARLRRFYRAALSSQSIYDAKKEKQYDKTHKHVNFEIGDIVLIAAPKSNMHKSGSKKLSPVYSPPHKVIHKLSDLNYRVQGVETGKIYDVNVQRMLKFNPREGEDLRVKNIRKKARSSKQQQKRAMLQNASSQHEEAKGEESDSVQSSDPELQVEEVENLNHSSDPESEPEPESESMKIIHRYLVDDEWFALLGSNQGSIEVPWDEVPSDLRRQYSKKQRSSRRKKRVAER